jgi:hypothetical protein
MNLVLRVFALVVSAILWACSVSGQEIRIRVVDARSGKAINNECVSVSLGTWHGGDLIAPTNKAGAVVLHLTENEVIAAGVSPSPCNRIAVLGPKPLPKGIDTIAVTSNEYIDCQEWAKVIPEEAPKNILNRAPSYQIEKILESGVAAGNRCGKFTAEAKPGELIFFVRPASFWEKVRR